MKKLIICLFSVLCLSLFGLTLVCTNEVQAVEKNYYEVPVVFELTQQQIDRGITFQNGSTQPIQGFFNSELGFYAYDNGIFSTTVFHTNVDYNGFEGFNQNGSLVYIFEDRQYLVTVFDFEIDWAVGTYFDITNYQGSLTFRYEFYEDFGIVSYRYRSSAKFNSQNIYQYYYSTNIEQVSNVWGLGLQQQVNRFTGTYVPFVGDEIITGYTIDGVSYTINQLDSYIISSSFTNVSSVYSSTFAEVQFYDGLTYIGVQNYPLGEGTIKPPSFNFPVGQYLVGWSLTLGGSVMDLSSYNLENSITLYAVKSFNPYSDSTGGKFPIEFGNCGAFDISCWVNNGIVYLLNEMPMFSDVFNFFYPIYDLLLYFDEVINLFDIFGYIYIVGLGYLFIRFMMVVFK